MNRLRQFDLNVTESCGTVACISVTSWSNPFLSDFKNLHCITPQMRSFEEVKTYVDLLKADLDDLLVQASQYFGPKPKQGLFRGG